MLFRPLLLALCFVATSAAGQAYDIEWVDIPGGTFTMGEPESSYEGPPGTFDAPEHTVTVSGFSMTATEVTNAQYVAFLNAALTAGLVEVGVGTGPGPDDGQTLVFGTASAPAEYAGIAMVNLSGTRVMKDHIDDGDGDPFTGIIQPENPLNISFIGYDESRSEGDRFYVKDPRDTDDFDWVELTNYYNYTDVSRQLDTSVLLNDYDAWPELEDFPNNLPTVDQVANWPASFIRWYGAKAFALFYDWDLPTEAEWEYAGQGGAAFENATDDGQVDGDGTSANWNHLFDTPSLWHVEDVKRGDPNPYGLYNMAGNVWEWVEDWYDASFYADATDPVNTTDSGYKVRRGGSWNYHQSTLKTAARAKDEQFKGNDHFGFRVVNRSADGTRTEEAGPVGGLSLSPNYPNPFAGSTTISFETASTGFVALEVFDLLGRKVATLASEVVAPGTHTRTWDARGVGAGMYVYRLKTETGTHSRIMSLRR